MYLIHTGNAPCERGRANGRKKPPSDVLAEADLLRSVLDFREGAAGACAAASVSYCVDTALPGQRVYTLAAHPGDPDPDPDPTNVGESVNSHAYRRANRIAA